MVTEHWSLIADVARRLLEAGELTGDEIQWACSGVKAEWCS